MYKLKFIIVYVELGTICHFGHPLEVLEHGLCVV